MRTVVQDPPRGTGDAARIGIELVQRSERVLILCGDTPLVRAEELALLVAALEQPGAEELSLMTCALDTPHGLWPQCCATRLGECSEVREQRDLNSPEQHAVREVNAGMYAGKRPRGVAPRSVANSAEQLPGRILP